MIYIFLGALSDSEKDIVNKIFSKMNIKMYNISLNILRSHPDAEEAVSQTFLKIIGNIEKISALSCPEMEPYCVIILKNETMNIIRKRKKIICVKDIDYLKHNDEERDIEDEFIKADNREKLLSCINRLSDDEKNLIYLRFINDMNYKHISELLDISEEAARKRGQRILKKLRLYYMEGDNSVRSS